MSVAVIVGVGVAGGLGAIARSLVGSFVTARARSDFPYGTLAVNLSGSFVLGLVVGAAVTGDDYRLIATGFIGAYTTFSAWAADSRRLVDQGKPRWAVANFVVSLLLGLAAIGLGRALG